MLELKAQGVAQVTISHRLTDIFEVGDRVMALKRGENVGTATSAIRPSKRSWSC